MSKRMRHRVDINGKPQWISGRTQQELCEDYMKKSNKPVELDDTARQETPFAAYANKWLETYHVSKVSEGTAKTQEASLRFILFRTLGIVILLPSPRMMCNRFSTQRRS